MRTDDFDYELPSSLIAQDPIMPRDASRLLYLAATTKSETSEHCDLIFHDLDSLVGPGDLLVFNNSRVIPARLLGRRKGLKREVEIFLLHPMANGHWTCMVRPGRRLKPGHEVTFPHQMKAKIERILPDGLREVSFAYEGSWDEALARNGEVPLPPYIKHDLDDPERYQTVYSKIKGSVAAPTAGLHFTPELIEACKASGAKTAEVTLHVGIGTFRPVNEENIEEHTMHKEFCTLDQATADLIMNTKKEGGRIIAVGTTVCRVLESFATEDGGLKSGSMESQIFIYPPYQFKIVDSLITNFHLPKSTLIMLVSCLAGREHILETYRYAVKEHYRFFSFGDAMFIDPSAKSLEAAKAQEAQHQQKKEESHDRAL